MKGAVHRIFQSRRLSGGSARSPKPVGKPDSRSYFRDARDGRNAENSHTVLYGTFVTSITRREVVNFDEALSVAPVTAEENKPFLHLKAMAVHLLLECFCRNVKTDRRTEKACELRIATGEVLLFPHEGKQFSDHIGKKQLPRETGHDIGMGSPVPLSAEAVGVITRLRNMKVSSLERQVAPDLTPF